MSNIVPLPAHLEPKHAKRSLLTSVRGHFYSLYNSPNDAFRKMLASVDNKTAITGNKNFDRKEAVDLIVKAAEKTGDTATAQAKAGSIYQCLNRVMGDHVELKLKLRRQEYLRLQAQDQQEAAE